MADITRLPKATSVIFGIFVKYADDPQRRESTFEEYPNLETAKQFARNWSESTYTYTKPLGVRVVNIDTQEVVEET